MRYQVKSFFLVFFLCSTVLFSVNCGTPPAEFPCKKANDDWKRCLENKVQYCHAASDTDGHLHWGQDCAAQGLTCEVIGTNNAACVDKSKSCQANESKCEKNTAYNCANGFFAVDPCGTAKECEIEGGKAHCHTKGASECGGHGHLHEGACECETGYKLDPNDATKCIAG